MKVLIISHNPISTYQSMGKSMRALFSAFRTEELCQLYLYPTIPDVKQCASYYRVTDKDVLGSLFFRRAGREVSDGEIEHAESRLFECEKDEAVYRNPKNKTPLRMLLRDLMWQMGHWFNRGLKTWIAREQPTCIFLAPGSAKLTYNIALKLSRTYHLPIVSYICDDFFFVKRADTVLGRLKDRLLQKKIAQTVSRSVQLITVSRGLEQAYGGHFHVPCVTVMTGSNYPIEPSVRRTETVRGLTYLGNIRCNRYVSLAEIGAALDHINAEKGTDYTLEIYSGEKDEDILEVLRKHPSVRLMGFVSGGAFDDAIHAADLLLHVEAFDADSIDLVKYSVSTKIADSLGSGICLFAYGPACVSSMRHLLENECAICATSKAELESRLLAAFTDPDLRVRTAQTALRVAAEYHDEHKKSMEFHTLMEKLHEGSAG